MFTWIVVITLLLTLAAFGGYRFYIHTKETEIEQFLTRIHVKKMGGVPFTDDEVERAKNLVTKEKYIERRELSYWTPHRRSIQARWMNSSLPGVGNTSIELELMDDRAGSVDCIDEECKGTMTEQQLDEIPPSVPK